MTNALATLNRVSESQVRAEKSPEFTDSWRPFSHAQILDAMSIAVKDAGLDVVNREYSMRPDSKMIACWEVKTEEKEFNFGISILNSIDKTHAVTLGCFERIFVCSNFMFRMEYERVMFRRHSGMLDLDEIVFLAKGALKLLIPKFANLRAWHNDLKSITMTAEQASFLTVAALRRGLLPPAKSPEFLDLFMGRNSKYREFGSSLYSWHGAATELMNDNSILTIASKQDKLNYFIDYEAPILLKKGKDHVVDFEKIKADAFGKYNTERAERKEESRVAFAQVRSEYKDAMKAEKDEGKADARREKTRLRDQARAEKKAERDRIRAEKADARARKIAEKNAKKAEKTSAQGDAGSTGIKTSDESRAEKAIVAPKTSPKKTDASAKIVPTKTRIAPVKTKTSGKKSSKTDDLRKMRESDAKKVEKTKNKKS